MIRDYHDESGSAQRVIDTINEAFDSMRPQDRDRQMQIHLAQGRGPARNLRLLCAMTAMLLKAKRLVQIREQQHAHERDL